MGGGGMLATGVGTSGTSTKGQPDLSYKSEPSDNQLGTIGLFKVFFIISCF